MWFSRFRKKSPIESQPTANMEEEIQAAQTMRARIDSQSVSLRAGLTALSERRKQNGFGDELEITFTPRNSH